MKGISVVIPCHGRVKLLKKLVKSIKNDAKQVFFPVEILLIDDTPEPEAEKIRAIAEKYNTRLLSGESHVGGKRNLGAKKARYEIILFLDSDVVICPGTLQAHYERLTEDTENRVGCLGKVEFVGKSTYAWKVIKEMKLTLPFSYPDVAEQVPWGPTANISFRREAFLKAGGFDLSMPRYGGEDVDLGLRISKIGGIIVTDGRALAKHTKKTWSTWPQNLKRLWDFGLADYYLLIRHPDRSFFDFPSAPVLWVMQILSGLMFIALVEGVTVGQLAAALIGSVLGYHVTYSLVKKKKDTGFMVHFLGPVIFYTMDIAKSVKAVQKRRFDLIFCRLKFLDDLIAQDWDEIASSAWGLSVSTFIFVVIMFLFYIYC